MIVVTDTEGLIVFLTEDDALLTPLQTALASTNFTVTQNPPTTGAMASEETVRRFHLRIVKFRLKQRRAALKLALQNATTLAQMRPALKNLFEMFEELIELME